MNNRIIGLTTFLGISTLLAVGCSNNNTELASNNKPVIVSLTPDEQQLSTKKECFAQLKVAFETEKAKLEAMSSRTPEEIEKNVEQGRKVKEIGWELGLLEKEVDPDYPRRELESKLVSSKQHFNGNELLHHYKRTNNPKYNALFILLEYKKEQIAQIEKEYQEKSKAIPNLLQELDELIVMTEIPK
ncbi:hypothetical protein [Paenibacillus sedimenti]|uniref:Lipoprotein n=1 Tax=Paenibacillus sedimenti TaxID=2770274 RepID=A0A926KQ95_9BACL|nr:hypothetical protein [Paenibacillus sedimenti]MBD0380946.1 hypothetical protein [Paenibacillus sedimenti]